MSAAPAAADRVDPVAEVLTPEHVHVRLVPAGLGRRLVAALVDFGCVLALSAMVALLLRGFLPSAFEQFAVVTSSFVIALAWHPVLEGWWEGRTLGKRAVGIRVVDARGLPLAAEQVVVRNAVRALDFLPFGHGIGGTCALLDPLGRRLGDLAAGTLVVDDRPQGAGSAAQLPPARRFNSLRSPRVLRRLRHEVSLEERDLLLRLCLRADWLPPPVRYELMERAGGHYRRRLGIDDDHLSGENLVRDLTALLHETSAGERRRG